MIQENEIMIGNYLQVAEDVSGFDTPYVQVKSIEPGKINREEKYDLDIETDYEDFFTPNELYGIPITESILARCGFVGTYKSEWEVKYMLINDPSIECRWNKNSSWRIALHNTPIATVSNLHSLQNIIKGLTNRTVTLK